MNKFFSENYLLIKQKTKKTKSKKLLEQIELSVEHSHKICVIYNGWDKKKVLNPLKGGQKPRFDCIFRTISMKNKIKTKKIKRNKKMSPRIQIHMFSTSLSTQVYHPWTGLRCSVAGLTLYPVPYHPHSFILRQMHSDARRYGLR